LLLLPEFWAAPLLLTYISIDNEVDTRTIVRSALEEGRRIAIPRIRTDATMDWVEIQSLETLSPGKHGIPEPPSAAPPLVPCQDSVVLVPALAFNAAGHRIGFGGGYFDRFLAGFEGVSIGLAYDYQVIEPWPLAPHDRPVQFVVTESAVYRATPSSA
jgi:5-formyltetrahydrofolate cyclo-ligase